MNAKNLVTIVPSVERRFDWVNTFAVTRKRGRKARVPGDFALVTSPPLEVEPDTGANQMLLQIKIKFPLNVSNKPPCVGVSHGN